MLAFLFKFFIGMTLIFGVIPSLLIVLPTRCDSILQKVLIWAAIALGIGLFSTCLFSLEMYNDSDNWNTGVCANDNAAWIFVNGSTSRYGDSYYYKCPECGNAICLKFSPEMVEMFFDN